MTFASQLGVFAAAAPNIVSYQGRLLDVNGVPVTSASATVIFRLYDDPTAGNCLWSNSSATCASATGRTVTLTDGLFSENLGDTAAGVLYAAIPDTVFADNSGVYLSVSVNGELLTPRKQLTAAPYAINSQTLDGLSSSAFLQTSGSNTATGIYDLTGATVSGTNALVFEGSVADANETAFAITNPTAARTVTFQDNTGVVPLGTAGNTLFFTTSGATSLTLPISGTLLADEGNALNFTDFADALTLDASTAIGFGASTFNLTFTNNGSGDEIHNLSSTGDFVIQDNGTPFATFTDAGAVTFATTSGQLITLGTTSANLALQTTTSGDITATTGAAAGLFNVLTGNLKVGSGTPGVALNGEDAYITGTIEVDGAAQFDGILTASDLVCTDCLDFDSLADNLTLDTSTTVGFGTSTFNLTFQNNGSGHEVHNLASTGDFIIQDNTLAFFTLQDDRNLIYEPLNTAGMTLAPSLVDGARSTAALTVSQANNVTNNFTGTTTNSLFSVQQNDLASSGTAAYVLQQGTGTALEVVSNTLTGSGQSITANSLTTGTALIIPHTTSVIANGGSLARLSSTSIDTSTTTGALLDLSSTASLAGTQFLQTYSGLTTGIGQSLVANALTGGVGTNISSSSTAFTGDLLAITQSGSNAANTGNLVDISNTGVSSTNTAVYVKHYATGTNNLALRVDDENGDTTPFVIDGAGNVGIGTSAPITQLHVSGSYSSTAYGSVSGGVTSDPYRVDVQGRYAYSLNIGTTDELKIYDISNPASPIARGSIATGTLPMDIQVQGKYAYVVNYTSNTLQVFDVSNPTAPSSTGSVDLTSISSFPSHVRVAGRYAYVATQTSPGKLIIVDVSNPANPSASNALSVSFPAGYAAEDLVIEGNYAYVLMKNASNVLRVGIYNISSPQSAPSLAGAVNLTSTSAWGSIAVHGRYAYVVGNSVYSVDVSNPALPTETNALSLGAASVGTSINLAERYAVMTFINGSAYGYAVINISDPTALSIVQTITKSTGGTQRGFEEGDVQGRFLYTTNDELDTFEVYDLGGAYLQQLEAGSIESSQVAVRGRLDADFVNAASGASVGGSLNVSGDVGVKGQLQVAGSVPTAATGSVTTGTGPQGLYVQGRYAYVLNYTSSSLQIFNVSNPAAPVSVGGPVATGSNPYDVYVQGRYAYVINVGSNTLQIFDVSNPAAPVSVVSVNTGTNPRSVYVQGRYAYVTNWSSSSLQIFDVSNPAAPVSVGSVNTGTNPRDVNVQGRYAYVINQGADSLQIFDVSNPAAPVSVGGPVATGDSPIDVHVQGSYAYVVNTGTSNTFQIFDVSNPAAPVSVGGPVATGTLPSSVYVQGRYAYVTNYSSNTLQIFDVSNPAAPVSVGSVNTGTSPYFVYVQGRYAYVTNYGSATLQLQVFDVGGGYVQQFEAGGVETGTLSVRNNIQALDGSFAGGLTVGSSLQVSGYAGFSSPTLTQTTTATSTLSNLSITSGALVQNTLAGTINWRGIALSLPAITQTTGTVVADGLRILVPASAAITTGGTMNGINIVAPTTSGPAAGALNGLNIANLTSAGTGTETAFYLGSGWDTAICFDCDGTYTPTSVDGGLQWGTDASTTQILRLYRSNAVAAAQITISDGAATVLIQSDTTTTSINLSAQVGGTAQRLCHNGVDAATGVQQVGDCGATQADLAEYYGVADNAVAGEIVVPFGQATEGAYYGGATTFANVVKSGTSYQSAIGVISTNPSGEILGEAAKPSLINPKPIALVGRTPLKVNAESGSIAAGDPIATSSTAGVGMKATQPGPIVGYALSDWAGPGEGAIVAFIQPGWNASSAISTDGSMPLFTDSFAFSSLGTATAGNTGKDSHTLSFRGSGWNGSSAEQIGMGIKLAATDATAYRLSFTNKTDTEVAYVTGTGDLVLSGKLYPSDRGVAQTGKYIYYDGSAGPGGDFMRTNASGWSTGSYDFAEMFPSTQGLAPGELVVASPAANEHVERSSQSYQKTLLGIVSTKPGFLAGDNKEGQFPIALKGRVPTLVNNENGPVAVGDPLTSSSTPGYAMKATKAGPVVGYALEPFDGPSGAVVAFVSLGWWEPDAVTAPVTSTTSGIANTASQAPVGSSSSSLSLDGNLFMAGVSIASVGRISGIADRWSIEEDGTVKTEGTYKAVITSLQNEKVDTYATLNREQKVTISGTGRLVSGMATIQFESVDPKFNDITSTTAPVRILVTLRGPASGVYVAQADHNGFDVRELANGTSTVDFDWYAEAYRLGQEPPTMVVTPTEPLVTDPVVPVVSDPVPTTVVPIVDPTIAPTPTTTDPAPVVTDPTITTTPTPTVVDPVVPVVSDPAPSTVVPVVDSTVTPTVTDLVPVVPTLTVDTTTQIVPATDPAVVATP